MDCLSEILVAYRPCNLPIPGQRNEGLRGVELELGVGVEKKKSRLNIILRDPPPYFLKSRL